MQNNLIFGKYLSKPVKKNNQLYFEVLQAKTNKKKYKFRSYIKATKNFDKNKLLHEGGKRIKGYFRRSVPNKPLITIITIVFNNDKDLENTIKSVLHQKYNNIEYIIIDGGSNKSVISKIKRYENYIDYWISQKDNGIFDAYNKGIKLASGDFIGFLNVGDYFTENAINFVLPKIKKKNLDIIFGSVKKKKIYSGFSEIKITKALNIFPSLMSTFINIDMFKRYGLFDLSFSFYNDYEFIYRLIKKKKLKFDITSKKEVITVFDLNGFSSKINIYRRLIEELKIRIKYENFFLATIKMIFKFFRYHQLKFFNQKKFNKYN